MCGIAAHFAFRTLASPLDLGRIRHRGPDAQGEWTSPDGNCWLGNTRLAIIDLSPTGAQPMADPATGNVLVINGEIYNHREVREQLGDLPWRGTSDTETVLQAYARWGGAMLEKLRGMFALAIYDAQRRTLFVARDRLGIKPLYYVRDTQGIRLGSEVKLFGDKRDISSAAIAAYLQWGACPERQLLFDGIEMLPAGHSMTVSVDGSVAVEKYWPGPKTKIWTRGAAPLRRDAPARVQVRRLLEDAVEEHLLSDVPVGSFLSGGIDSSIVTALAARKLGRNLQTFSVAFDMAEFDESAIAHEVAQRYETEHHKIQLSEEEVLVSVTEAIEKLDLPSVDAINTYIVSRAVTGRGVKVALSGLGGDELFGGYASFRDVPRLRLLAKVPRPFRRLLSPRLADIPAASDAETLAAWRRRFFTDGMLARAGLPRTPLTLQSPPELPDEFARISWTELSGYMRHILLRDADQMSMAVSLELRVPFLDHRLVEYVLALPAAEKKKNGLTKALLVESCRDLLPASVYERPKRGFALPMRNWMRGPLAGFVSENLGAVGECEWLPNEFIGELQRAFQNDQVHWTRLWSLVVLGRFAKRSAASAGRGSERLAASTPVRAGTDSSTSPALGRVV